MRKIKVGVIGVGTIGTAHASCIYNGEIEEMELCALCDSDKARIEELKYIHISFRQSFDR